MKSISIAFENALLNELNIKAKQLRITRAEVIRNAIMEFLFHFDERADAVALTQAIAANEPRRPLAEMTKKLRL